MSIAWQCAPVGVYQSPPTGGWTLQDLIKCGRPIHCSCFKVGVHQLTPNFGWALHGAFNGGPCRDWEVWWPWPCAGPKVGAYQLTPNGGWTMLDFPISISISAKVCVYQSTPTGDWTRKDFLTLHVP